MDISGYVQTVSRKCRCLTRMWAACSIARFSTNAPSLNSMTWQRARLKPPVAGFQALHSCSTCSWFRIRREP